MIYITGLSFNLLLICYFKYAYFIIDLINELFTSNLEIGYSIFLPLGISFFTFQQIAYLSDIYEKPDSNYSFIEYALFISFFPQLIAGPIVHHKELIPQLRNRPKFNFQNISVGITIFILGLSKKILIADNLALISTPYFTKASQTIIRAIESWIGLLAYTFQIYFDFSGYCDMAIGIGILFGIQLPLNFYSPYKAKSIIEFWRLWHITLSTFLRDYIYIPLGGNRKGNIRRYINLITTMLIGGLWHGASFNFIIWGGLHGLYLIINHGLNSVKDKISALNSILSSRIYAPISITITFISVMFAWIFFKCPDLETSHKVINALIGKNGIGNLSSPPRLLARKDLSDILEWLNIISSSDNVNHIGQVEAIIFLLFSGFLAWCVPNPIRLLNSANTFSDPTRVIDKFFKTHSSLKFRFNNYWAFALAILFIICILLMNRISPFLYFQF